MTQLDEQQSMLLIDCFLMWQDETRRFEPGNNKLPARKRAQIIELIFAGHRRRRIGRLVGVSKVTVGRVMLLLRKFLKAQTGFPAPLCACGRDIWHRGICPVWDTYHVEAIRRGHETQDRIYEARKTAATFQVLATAAVLRK